MNTNHPPLAAVVGLGLIGGSIAKALSKTYCVIGYDPDQITCQQGIKTGVLTEAYAAPNQRLQDCTVVFLAAPPSLCPALLQLIGALVTPATLITDACSVKEEIVSCAQNAHLRFIGGHPMAGSEKSGFAASDSLLMENAYYLLTPYQPDPDGEALLHNIVQECFHAIPLTVSPKQHDLAVGLISHLPHAVSATLVNLVQQHDTPEHLLQKIAAGGFRDLTRISSSSPELWNGICSENRENLSELLDEMASMLQAFSRSLRQNKPVIDRFRTAKSYRDEIETGRHQEQGYEIKVAVSDRPGAIPHITELLSRKSINLSNLHISHSREFEGGALRLRLTKREDIPAALDLLRQNGYIAEQVEQ